MNRWTVPRDWEGDTCAVLGSGPSLTAAVADQLRGRCRVIAVNNVGISFKNAKGVPHDAVAPWADVLYAADRMWWHNNKPAAEAFTGTKVTVMPISYDDYAPADGVHVVGNGGALGFDERQDYIRTGWNSGFQAVHLAAHFGAKRILLFGFDMHADNGQHYFGDHQWRPGYKSRYELFLRAFKDISSPLKARGVTVLNCTPGSALKCFPQVTLEQGLSDGVFSLRESSPIFTGASAQSSGRNRAAARRSSQATEA